MLDLDMGPYGAYIWPAWGLTALVLALLVGRTLKAARYWKRELNKLTERSSKR